MNGAIALGVASQAGPSEANQQEPYAARGWRPTWIRVRGADLHVLDGGGSGEPLLLAHPGSGSAFGWDKQIDALKAGGLRPIAWSRRGFGWTRQNRVATSTDDFEIQIGDINAIASALGLPRFHLLGSAAGGMVALAYAVKNARRLNSLVIATTLGAIAEPDFRARTATLLPEGFEGLPADFKELGPNYRASDPRGKEEWLRLHRLSTVDEYGKPHEKGARGTPFVTWADLAALEIPVLLLAGGADLYSPPPVMAEIGSHLLGSRLHIFPTAGHSPQWECPDAFNAAILEFLSGTARRYQNRASRNKEL